MASIFFKRIAEDYGEENIKKGRYGRIVREIISNNNTKISNKLFRLTNRNYKESIKKLKPDTAKIIKLPTDQDILSKRLSILKSAEKGKMISETLRDQLQRNLRDALNEFKGDKLQYQRGRAAGKINPQLIESFQKRISETFASRTKTDKGEDVPGNVKTIAVTEIRSIIDDVKETYTNELLRRNPNLVATKKWIHNRRLSKKPRETHMQMHNITIPKDQKFKVPRESGGFDYMDRPHDPDAIGEQVIGCNCDIVYSMTIKQ